MPTTANNETLERIKSDAERIYPGKSAIAQSTQQVYQNGAISERDKAIDEAIEIVKAMQSGDKPIRYNQEILECYKKLEALKSDKK